MHSNGQGIIAAPQLLLRGSSTLRTQRLVLPLAEIRATDLLLVGGKNASLGEMLSALAPLGIRVPDGFAVTTDAFRLHLREAGLTEWVAQQMQSIAPGDTRELAATAATIRARITQAPLPNLVRTQLMEAYQRLSASSSVHVDQAAGMDVAVRSSATAEDLPTASFAGQQESYLHVRGAEALDVAVRKCMASLFTDRAIVYRINNGIPHEAVALSVGVQRMVRSDLACAGTMFTLDTETGFRGVVLIDAAWGLGETIVKGRVRPDEYWVHKATAKAGFQSIIRKELGQKSVKLVYDAAQPSGLRVADVLPEDQRRFALRDDEVMQLTQWALLAEAHASRAAGRDVPLDIEWAKDGRTGELFLLQSRPETVHARTNASTVMQVFRLQDAAAPLLRGKSVGTRIGAGVVRVIHGTEDLHRFQPGEVLVAQMTDPDWEPVLRKAAAIVTDRGGRTCHAAIVSREMGLPCIVGCDGATTTLRDGQMVTVSCAGGDVGVVHDGRVPFTCTDVDPATLPVSRVPLMLNIADPGQAFRLSQLPNAGVGLLRIEFLVSSWIGIHPMALVHPERVADAAERDAIMKRAAGHATPPDFFVERLAHGIGQIAAAFHPKPVIVRFSDFKTNEYASLLGGAAFEPHEDNPMIGLRGASRYYDPRYREGFALECAAVRRVRETMGLRNVVVMIPFCRTLKEARLVLTELARNGIARGANDLKVYMMCEIPSNAVLASEFSELFDGFSIGSNDLTQLTLGVDRDSELLSHIFDERDPAVQRLIHDVVTQAHARRVPVGICGEAPSSNPAFAAWLADIGIDSMSLSPDALPEVARTLATPTGAR